MSYKDVLKIFKLERELSDDESALLNTLREMSDTDRELLAETLGPPAKGKVKSASKKFKKCDVCGVSKKATRHRDTTLPDYHVFDEGGLAKEAVKRRGLPATTTTIGSNHKPTLCTFEIDGKVCKGREDDTIHDPAMEYTNYHPFVSSSSVHPAVGQSSTSGNEVNSETGSEDVSSVARG